MRTLATVALCLLAVLPARAQDHPLPQLGAFLAQARTHLRTDRSLQSQYTYLERRADIRMSKLGKLGTGLWKVYEVYPGVPPVQTYRRLIEVDGKPLPKAELDQNDRGHQKTVLDVVGKYQNESASDRAKRVAHQEKLRHEDLETIDDLFNIYQFKLVERQMLNGHPTIVVAFSPKPGMKPKTDDGKIMVKAKGRAWVSETDFEVARVEVEMLDDVSVGLVLGKLYKGSTASFERRRVNDEVWLPAEARFNGQGRALVRKFSIDTVVQYYGYKKFSVGTDTTFTIPK
jgi:hypothetical protein